MIEILNYKSITDGKKIGYVDVKLKNGMVIRRIAHMYSNKGKWFNFPCYSEEMHDKSKKYIPLIEFQLDAHNGQFFEILSEKVKEYKAKHNITDPEPIDLGKEELPF